MLSSLIEMKSKLKVLNLKKKRKLDQKFRAIQNRLREENEKSTNSEMIKKRFKALSWNIDGLDPSNLESRTTGVIQVIKK